MLETAFGRSQQFGKLANQGLFNYGAEEHGRPPCGSGFATGSDVGQVCFYVFPSDDEAADHFLSILKKTGIPLDQGATAQSAAMRKSGYYGGFHWAPGYNEIVYKLRPQDAIEESDAATADAKNIASYASGITRYMNQLAGPDQDLGGPGPTRAGSHVLPLKFTNLSRQLTGLAILGGLVASAVYVRRHGIPLPHGQRFVFGK
jgi:hypothetical protein